VQLMYRAQATAGQPVLPSLHEAVD
jgi:hypothetical protein